MIPNRVVRQGEYIIDTSGIVDRLINGYRTTTRGRPPSHDKLRLMLLALYLTAHQRRTLMLKTAFNTLTNDIDLKTKIRLGVCDPVRHRRLLVSCCDFYNFARAIKTGLAWIDTPDSRIPPNDHTRRRQIVEDCCDAVMDVFPTRWEESATVAIDATGIHAWGRSMPKKTIDVLDEMDLSGTDIKDKQKRFERRLAKRYEHEPDQAPPVKARREWEARYGNKTDKNGREAVFFGYHEHTVVISGALPVGRFHQLNIEPVYAAAVAQRRVADALHVRELFGCVGHGCLLAQRALGVAAIPIDRGRSDHVE